jgi:hypothetical protein
MAFGAINADNALACCMFESASKSAMLAKRPGASFVIAREFHTCQSNLRQW